MKLLLGTLVALFLSAPALSADKKTDPAPDSKITVPVAKFVGPTTAATGRMVILKTTGSLGDDPQITCTPTNTNWYAVRFQDGTLGVVFDTDQPGSYIFALAVNKSGRTAVTVHVVVVSGNVPNPTPGPGPTASLDLSAPYAKDLAPGTAKLLAQCYSQSITSLFPSFKTYADCQSGMKELIDTTVGADKLTNTRAAIAAYVRAKLGTNANDAFQPTYVTPVWNDVIAALKKLP